MEVTPTEMVAIGSRLGLTMESRLCLGSTFRCGRRVSAPCIRAEVKLRVDNRSIARLPP